MMLAAVVTFCIFLAPILFCVHLIYNLIRMHFKLSGFIQLPGSMVDNFFKLTDLNNMLTNLLEFKRKFGDTLKVHIAGFPAIITSDPKMLEFLLGTNQILDKSMIYFYLNRWLGEGLLTSKAEKWRKMRKIITPAFHFQILDQYIENFHSAGLILVEKLKQHVGKGAFDVYPYVTLCTLDVICESAMGIKVNAQRNSESSYVKAVRGMCKIIIDRTLNPVKMFHFIYMFSKDYKKEKAYLKILHGYTNALIKSKKEDMMRDDYVEIKGKKLAFLDLILQSHIDGRPLTDEEVREEVDTFMFAGHDTTASGISFILYCLSKHPEEQERVFQELNDIFGDDKTAQPTLKELNQMRYLEMVIKESLRLYPPVPFIGRCPPNDTKYNEGFLPCYSQLIVFTYGIHHDPNIYEDPEKFDPERFLPERQSQRHPYGYLTFSAGSRNCIGQKFAMLEMKSTISHILRRYRITQAENFQPKLIPVTVLKSTNGIQIQLEERR